MRFSRLPDLHFLSSQIPDVLPSDIWKTLSFEAKAVVLLVALPCSTWITIDWVTFSTPLQILVGGFSPENRKKYEHTVDGRNPAPVDTWFIPLFIGFQTIQGGAGFLPSTVWNHIWICLNYSGKTMVTTIYS